MENTCIFCNLQDTKIVEGKYFFGVLDAHPASFGHALLIPKRHVEKINQLIPEESAEIGFLVGDIQKVIESIDLDNLYQEMLLNPPTKHSEKFITNVLSVKYIDKKPDGYNIGINEGVSAGQSVPHLHIHIIPRYIGDEETPRGGVRGVISESKSY